MNIEKQPSGTALTDTETKDIVALLVKLGYTVRIARRSNERGAISVKVIEAAEEKQ